MTRRLSFPGADQGNGDLQNLVSGGRRLVFPKTETPVEPPKVKSINPTPAAPIQRRVAPRTVVDDMIDQAVSISTDIHPIEIKGKLTALQTMDLKGILDWGEGNLKPLRAASQIQSELTARLSQIDAAGWLKQTMEASTKKPGLLGNLLGVKSPDYYEAMLNKARAELMKLVVDMDTIATNYKPEVHDLLCDAVCIQVVAQQMTDQSNQSMAINRSKSLMAAYQTGEMLLQMIVNSKMQAAQFTQQIDDLFNTTLPSWKLAYSK